MLSSAKHQRNLRISSTNKNQTLKTISSSTPSSSSSSSSSQDSQVQKRSLVTMEEVWKDINLASIRHSQHPQNNHEPRFRSHNTNSIFQDFLNRPLRQEPTPTSLTMSSASNGDSTSVSALFSSPLPPPATALSLNLEFMDSQDPLFSHRHISNISSFNTPFDALVTSTCFGKKTDQDSNEGSGNRRHKRMIKNRESAARSRARKQAYTNELELEVAHLQAENARLKREQDQLRITAANQQPKKNTLQRSYTAPF